MTLAEAEARPKKAQFALKTANALVAEFDALLGDEPARSPKARMAILAHIRQTLADARKSAEAELLANNKGTRCAQNLSAAQDEIIIAVHRFATTRVYPVDNPSGAEAIALSAVGGYGRGTLAPGSDIDLLFILPYKQTPWGEQVTEYILYMLWDLGQKVGHAVRSVDECIRMARADMTVRTATLEARFLTGDKGLYDQLTHRFETEIMPRTGPEFIAAKMAERDERHKQMGNTRYVVEPNIKDGKGGLRDLNTLFWIGKYFYQVKTSHELVGKGVLSAAEYRLFNRAEDFLWAVRCHLHFVTGRADEKLSFDMQPELAQRMGYEQRLGMLGVERFMKRYFLVAKDVGDLTRIICAGLEFHHAKDLDLVGRVLAPFRSGKSKIKGETAFIVDTGRLNIAGPDVFEKAPVNLIRAFMVAGREELLFHPDAIMHIRNSLRLIDKTLRADPKANAHFLTILTSANYVERILRQIPEQRQAMLFSATMPDPIITLARTFMNQPTHIRAESAQSSQTHDTTEQFIYRAHALDKVELVSRLQARIDAGENRARRILARVRLHQGKTEVALAEYRQKAEEAKQHALATERALAKEENQRARRQIQLVVQSDATRQLQ